MTDSATHAGGHGLPLDVPFVPDKAYAAFLSSLSETVESVHFSLGASWLADARNPLRETGLQALAAALSRLSDHLPGLSRYLLVNARFQDPERYHDPAHLAEAGAVLEQLKSEAGLTGIIFADAYYLNALSKAAPEACAGLQAVPSVNCMIDSGPKAEAYLRLVETSAFEPPARLVLDRGLNRDPERLAATAGDIKTRHPDMRLLLLANEGCLPHCPFKPAHDAHLALARMPGCGDRTHGINRDFGCLSTIAREPWRLFTSPFIRPEDVHHYEGLVDGIKVCGRERGGRPFLERAVGAYAGGRFAGNLLSIMDTLGEFERSWSVANEALPEDFWRQATSCGARCTGCAYCRGLARDLVKKQEVVLSSLEEEA